MASKLTQLLFNDGEGVYYDDLNAVSDELRRHTVAALFGVGRMNAGEYDPSNVDGGSLAKLHVLGDSCAPSCSGSVNLRVDVLGGIVAQSTGWVPYQGNGLVASGDDLASVLAYCAFNAELSTVHDPGDASDRWDLVSVTISQVAGDSASRDFKDATTGVISTAVLNKRRNVVIAKTVTKGTPGSGTIPATPAGACRLYAIKVPALATGLLSNADLIDFRVPAGRTTIDVWTAAEHAAGRRGGTACTTTIGAMPYVTAGDNTSVLYHLPAVGQPHSMRLMAVCCLVGPSPSSAFELYRFAAAGTGTLLQSMSAGFRQVGLTSGQLAWAKQTSPTAGFIGATNPALCGWWANGYQAGYANRDDQAIGVGALTRIGLRFGAAAGTDQIAMVRFLFAGGLG